MKSIDETHLCFNCIHCNEFNDRWMCTVDLVSLPTWSDSGGEGTAWEITDNMNDCKAKETV